MTTTSLKATRLDPLTLNALAAIATPDEIAVVSQALNNISTGHCESWMATYIANILNRLARTAPQPAERKRKIQGVSL